MGVTFIIKRKNYAIPAIVSSVGGILTGPRVATGMTVGGSVMDAKSTVSDREDKEEFDYINPSQKQYGAIQAVKEVGTGVGKGLLNWGKNNKKSMKSLVGFGAAMGAGTYGINRIQRQKAEIESGEREANGMSTRGKVATGAAALGTGGYVAYNSGKSHSNALNKANERLTQSNKLLEEANKKGLSKISDKASKDIASNKAVIDNLNKTKLGMSNKAFKMTRNGLLTGGIIAGAGLLANNTLKQKNNSVFGAASKLANRALGGKSLGKAVSDGDWKNIGKAAGAYVNSGVKSVSNFLTPGKGGASSVVRSVEGSLKKQGEYGKKAADFLSRHRTAAGVATAATVGTGVFNVTNSIGEKGVSAVTNSLDKKTAQYVKSKENQNDKV